MGGWQNASFWTRAARACTGDHFGFKRDEGPAAEASFLKNPRLADARGMRRSQQQQQRLLSSLFLPLAQVTDSAGGLALKNRQFQVNRLVSNALSELYLTG